MAERQTFSQRIGLTRGRAATIAVLAVALVGVICFQYGGAGEEEFSLIAAEGPLRRAPRTAGEESAAAESEFQSGTKSALASVFDPAVWKSPELSKVAAYDPFALPASFPRPPQAEVNSRLVRYSGSDALIASADAGELASAIERYRMELEALQQRGVQVIVRGRDKYVAWIGDRMVHVGDEINGFTVTAIEPDGVRLERKVDQ